ncbi:hypothetical protein [Rhizobium ruizarguesonis]|jgi:hypothetical protein|uniref:hypothetical protein n=1 Tax=Rhizobium ruizarguesonis TaxID=2081791 RepID=UPI00103032C0|nr:hypothetical protein [Rhizobium ruizarguesonis]TBA24761.1 hypothetical protein ELH61_02615 [Rhizobium ruizarguesonis]
MRFSDEAGAMFMMARWGDLMHDIVRSFALKHGLDESLGDTPEVAWEWIYESLKPFDLELDIETRNEVAACCFRSIRARMRATQEGGRCGIH